MKIMKLSRTALFGVIAGFICANISLGAEIEKPETAIVISTPFLKVEIRPKEEKRIDVKATMLNIVFMQNDSDFDSTAPAYDKNGQSLGFIGTLFRPQFTLTPNEHLRLYYELELGMNAWSKNNPDQYNPTANDAFFMKHRELYSAGSFMDDRLGFKVGYQYYRDPTGLFLAHWMGAGTVYTRFDDVKLYVTAGQVPDSTYEGFVVGENNFKQDTFTFNLGSEAPLTKWLSVKGGLFSLLDNHVVDRSLWLLNPCLRLEMDFDSMRASFDAVMQLGKSEFTSGEGDATIVAYALQAHGDFYFDLFNLYLNALLLSPDDSYNRNDKDGAFFYSGKNDSATIILTEDPIYDRGNNLDELLGMKDGGFYRLRSGLAVLDVKAEKPLGDYFIPALVAGIAMVPKAKNALDQGYVGSEVDLDLGFKWHDSLAVHLIGGLFVPGGASAAIINYIDTESKNNLYMAEGSISVFF